MRTTADLTGIYRTLLKRFGSQHWWPGDTPFEVIVGAVLTQNTNWKNVERAIKNLKTSDALDPQRIDDLPVQLLKKLIRPAGFFNQKASYLKGFCRYYLEIYDADIRNMRSVPTAILRPELLEQKGIGPETADSILLYALHKPVFVIDAYTKRIFSRHGVLSDTAPYDRWQEVFMAGLTKSAKLFNEYHALIVRSAKEHCRTKPICNGCPLQQATSKTR